MYIHTLVFCRFERIKIAYEGLTQGVGDEVDVGNLIEVILAGVAYLVYVLISKGDGHDISGHSGGY